MVILFFALAIISSGIAAPLYKRVSAESTSPRSSALIPLIWFIPLAAFFGAVSISGNGYNAAVIPPALLSGAGAAVSSYILLESFKRGQYTLSVIIVNLNFYVPILLSWLLLGEKATLYQLIGILLLTAVIIALNIGVNPKQAIIPNKGEKPDMVKKSGRAEFKTGLKAVAMPLFACLANGMLNFGIKLRQYLAPGGNGFDFFALCYLFGAGFCLVIFLALKLFEKKRQNGGFIKKETVIPALLIAFSTGVCYLSISLLSEHVNAAAEFTIVTTGSILLSLAVGWVKFKEKFTLKSALSLLCFFGAVALQFLSY